MSTLIADNHFKPAVISSRVAANKPLPQSRRKPASAPRREGGASEHA